MPNRVRINLKPRRQHSGSNIRTLNMDLAQQRQQLVADMRRHGYLTPETEAAFLSVPREEFVPEASREQAYADCALPLCEGATISQPSMIAIMLRELKLKPGMRVLEVGSGSGYVLALLAQAGAEATGVEIIPGLAERSQETLERLGIKARVIQGDASKITFDEKFDRIVFSAAVRELPAWAIDLLSEGGFVLAPVGRAGDQELARVYKDRIEWTGCGCRFVPFV